MLVAKPAVTTNEGKKLQILNMSGAQIEFTKLAVGSGLYSDVETAEVSLCQRTSLKDRKQLFGISSVAVTDDGKTLILSSMITNADLSEGYTIREIGLYARIKDRPDTECLASISLAEIEDDFPAYDGNSESRILMKYQFTVSNTDSVYLSYEHDPVVLAKDAEKMYQKLSAQIIELKNLFYGERWKVMYPEFSCTRNTNVSDKKHIEETNNYGYKKVTDVNDDGSVTEILYDPEGVRIVQKVTTFNGDYISERLVTE